MKKAAMYVMMMGLFSLSLVSCEEEVIAPQPNSEFTFENDIKEAVPYIDFTESENQEEN